jgi:hypothetical protein
MMKGSYNIIIVISHIQLLRQDGVNLFTYMAIASRASSRLISNRDSPSSNMSPSVIIFSLNNANKKLLLPTCNNERLKVNLIVEKKKGHPPIVTYHCQFGLQYQLCNPPRCEYLADAVLVAGLGDKSQSDS